MKHQPVDVHIAEFEGHAHLEVGYGRVQTREGGELGPMVGHIIIHRSTGQRVLMTLDPHGWAGTIAEMTDIVEALGGPYREALDQVMRYRSRRFN